MAYLRWSSILKYVEGGSSDYIFGSSDEKGDFIVDYDEISNEGLVEIICRALEKSTYVDNTMRDYLKYNLAAKLNIKLRDKVLTSDEEYKMMMDRLIEPEIKTEHDKYLDSIIEEMKKQPKQEPTEADRELTKAFLSSIRSRIWRNGKYEVE